MSEIPCNVIYICPGDPYSSPRGGQTAFAIQALNALGARLALVAPDESGTRPIGKWFLDDWKGRSIWRFNIGSYAPPVKSCRPLIPRRIIFQRLIKKHISSIRQIQTRALFCDSPELLGVLKNYHWSSFCYRFAGLNNPVGVSRYVYLRFLSNWFHKRMLTNLIQIRPDVLLASADMETIAQFEHDNQKQLMGRRIIFFPTRFDQDIFCSRIPQNERAELGLADASPVFVIVGRLCWVKGWKLALQSLKFVAEKYPNVKLLFVGDGEERLRLETYATEIGVKKHIRVEGFLSPHEVHKRLVASDLYLCTSYREGWSVAMTEALGCGKICVSTNVSGAEEMIADRISGRIVKSRDPLDFAIAIEEALLLNESSDNARMKALEISRQFSSATLAEEWGKLWTPLVSDNPVLTK